MSEYKEINENRICFDWCSIQKLFEKANKNEIEIEQITNKYTLILTMMNVHEASLNKNREQRFAHLGFCHDLFCKNRKIVVEPEVMLKKSYFAFKDNLTSFDIGVERDVFDFLLNPQKYPEDYIPLRKEAFRKENKEFMEMNKDIRNDPRIKHPPKVANHFSLIEFLSTIFEHNDFLNERFLGIKNNLGIKDNFEVDGASFMRNVIPWKLYLSSFLTGNYLLSYEQKKLTEPQTPDLKQMIYLPLCDYYITNDGWFLKALKQFIESKFIPVNTQVFELNDFLDL